MPPNVPRNWKMRIEDILEAIDEIASFTHGMTFETFAADRRTVRAVLYDFVIIGEAARHIPSESELAERVMAMPRRAAG
jgi:uncharacterized protein with HEPN domain